MVLGNTAWWKKLKVWCLEINENFVRIGQCKADVCLLTLYKSNIGVSRSSILPTYIYKAKNFNGIDAEISC